MFADISPDCNTEIAWYLCAMKHGSTRASWYILSHHISKIRSKARGEGEKCYTRRLFRSQVFAWITLCMEKAHFFHLMDPCYDSQSRPGTPCWNLSPIITQPLHPTTSRATNCSSTGCLPASQQASQHHATYQWKTPSPNPARATGRPQGSIRSLPADAESRIHRLLVVSTQKRCACVWHGFKQKAVAERCPHEWGVAVRRTAQPDS